VAPITLTNFIWPGIVASQCLYVVAKLGIADLVATSPSNLEELAVATKTDAAALRRLLRAAITIGLFCEDGEGRFHNSALSEVLRSDHPQSVRPSVLILPSPVFWRPLGELYETVKSGKPAFDRLHAQHCFEYFAEHPDVAAVLCSVLTDPPETTAAIARSYDFSRLRQIVDVGGGDGALLGEILSLNPGLRGIVFDLPGIVAQHEPRERMELQAGDFFEAVPSGVDAYLLRGIIHDWSDADAVRILANCRKAMQPDSTLLIVERVIDGSESGGSLTDLLVMVIAADRERTYAEFEALVREAGFTLVRSVQVGAALSILECRIGSIAREVQDD
jgi:O-methyltransferase domain/Dimerisation domain